VFHRTIRDRAIAGGVRWDVQYQPRRDQLIEYGLLSIRFARPGLRIQGSGIRDHLTRKMHIAWGNELRRAQPSSNPQFPNRFQNSNSKFLELDIWNLELNWKLFSGTSAPRHLVIYGSRLRANRDDKRGFPSVAWVADPSELSVGCARPVRGESWQKKHIMLEQLAPEERHVS
jgi:hypothetical protein